MPFRFFQSGALSNRYYRTLLAGQFISEFGDEVYRLALPWTLYDLSKSALVLGIGRLLDFLPHIVIGPIIGVLVDKLDRRITMMWGVFAQVVVVALMGLALTLGYREIIVIYLLSIILAIAGRFVSFSQTALVADLLPKDLLLDANAKSSLLSQIVQLIGPSLAGILISAIGAHHALWLDVLSFVPLLAAVCVLPKIGARIEKASPATSVWAEVREGLNVLLARDELFQATTLIAITNISTGALAAIGVFFLRSELGFDAGQVGVVFTGMTVGGVFGGILVPRFRGLVSPLLMQLVATIGLDFALLALGLTRVWVVVIGIYSIIGFLVVSINVPYVTLRQTCTPPEMLGRVTALTSTLMKLLVPLAMATSATLAQLATARAVIAGAGLLGVSIAAVAALVLVRRQGSWGVVHGDQTDRSVRS